MTYKLFNTPLGGQVIVKEDNENGTTTSIPFDPANTDYAQFKKDILDGAELVDADGQVMDAIQFVKELP